MNTLPNGGPVMVLYSDMTCPVSHCVRLALAEKDIDIEIKYIRDDIIPEELAELNPYNTVPTLVDRELTLYDAQIILEYLDERFPHPPLMPVDPMSPRHKQAIEIPNYAGSVQPGRRDGR